MGNFSLSRKNTFLMSFVTAVFLSVFALATLFSTMVPTIEDANALDCRQVDASSNGQCDIDRDISEEGFRDCVNGVNCFANQNVNVQNTLRSSEEAKIHLDLTQLINCGNRDCLNVFGQQEAINDATQRVDVRSGGSSVVDFDVDAHMTQRSDGEGQSPVLQNNFGTQEFFINAANSAVVDADGDGNDVEFRMDQFNDECDNSSCGNTAGQTYDIVAQGTSRVDISSDTGYTVNQVNNGCDDFDPTGATVDIFCGNTSFQELFINTANPSSTTTNRAIVTFDTLGLSTTDQTTDCEFGEIECSNAASSVVDINAIGTSRVDMDDIEQDVSQFVDCDNGIVIEQELNECRNEVFLEVEAQAASDGVINVNHGSQTITQSISCDDNIDQDCRNTARLNVVLGDDTNPVTGTLNTDYNQEVTQTIDCEDARCLNGAIMNYFATAKDSARVNSHSDQEIIQINDCDDGQVCNNNALMTNNVFASGNARLTANTDQSITQICNESSGPICTNNNMQTTSGSAINNAIFTYTTDQTLNNGPGAGGNGDQSITLQRSSGTSSQSVFQTQPGQTFP